MKTMYLNPIGIKDYNQTFVDMAREYKSPDNTVTVASLNESVGSMNNLEYRVYEALITGDTLKATRQAAVENYDAFIIGCFYDPVLIDARQIARDMIVVGPCQSSIEMALRLGNKYSVIIGQWQWMDQMEETIRKYGYIDQLSSFRSIDLSVPEMGEDPAETERRILEQSQLAISEDKAEVIVLGCTLEIGFYQQVQLQIGAPVIDPSIAALKTAEHAARVKQQCLWGTSHKWGMEAPSEADLLRFGILQDTYIFSQRIDVA
jgi:allantoin racemase